LFTKPVLRRPIRALRLTVSAPGTRQPRQAAKLSRARPPRAEGV